jgi:hypothetical protein
MLGKYLLPLRDYQPVSLGRKNMKRVEKKREICAERERKKEHGSGMVKFVQQEIK